MLKLTARAHTVSPRENKALGAFKYVAVSGASTLYLCMGAARGDMVNVNTRINEYTYSSYQAPTMMIRCDIVAIFVDKLNATGNL